MQIKCSKKIPMPKPITTGRGQFAQFSYQALCSRRIISQFNDPVDLNMLQLEVIWKCSVVLSFFFFFWKFETLEPISVIVKDSFVCLNLFETFIRVLTEIWILCWHDHSIYYHVSFVVFLAPILLSFRLILFLNSSNIYRRLLSIDM